MFFDPGLNGELVLRGGDYFGLFMLHQQYTNLRIEIQGQEAVITTPSNDFIKVRVPVGLAVGNHDILFKSDQGEFKLENAINYTSPFPQIVTLSKPAVFTNGVDTVDVTVKVEDANGNPAPDGSLYYVSLLGRNYTGNIINPDTGQQYGHERALPVSNGEIRFKVNSSYSVSPWEYTYNYSTSSFDAFTWPNPAAPSVQVRLCKAAYSSSKPGYGYYCAVQLFPQSGNTQEGRIYHVSAYEHNPLIVNVSPNGPRQEVVVNNLRDPLGNPLPEGTPVYMRQIIGGSGLLSREDGTSSSVMSFLSDTNGSVRFWYSPGPISCFSNGNGQDAISPLFASPTQVFGPSNPKEWLVGSPIIFRYPGC